MEQLLLMNPRRRRRRRRRLANPFRAHHRRRHRSYSANPRRRRRRRHFGFMANPRRRRRRLAFRRNPRRFRRLGGAGGFSTRSMVRGMLVPAAVGAAGGIGLDIAWGYVSPHLPASLQTGWGAAAGQAGTAVALGWGLSKALPRQRNAIYAGVVGALVIVAYNALKPLVQSSIGVSGLGAPGDYTAYRLPRVTYGRRVGVGAYLPQTMGRIGRMGLMSPAAGIQNPAAAMRGTMAPGVGGVAGYIPDSMG